MKKQRILWAAIFVFLLGIRDGYITLWKAGQSEPLRQFPYQARYLPEPDRRALEQGIRVEDPGQLMELLEDYLS